MRTAIRTTLLLLALASTRNAWGHGFTLSVNNYSDPTSLIVASQAEYLDPQDVTPGYPNLFIEEFGSTPSAGTNPITNAAGNYYYVEHGFAQTAGPFPPYWAPRSTS